jgi:hypothetical protein
MDQRTTRLSPATWKRLGASPPRGAARRCWDQCWLLGGISAAPSGGGRENRGSFRVQTLETASALRRGLPRVVVPAGRDCMGGLTCGQALGRLEGSGAP